MKKLLLLFISLFSLFLLASCKKEDKDGPSKDYERPQAEVVVNKEKSKYKYDEIDLNFTINIKNTYKFKEGDRISVEYKNHYTGSIERPFAARIKDDEYLLHLPNLKNNKDTEVKFYYHYIYRGKDSKRHIGDITVSANGENDPLVDVSIRDYDDYIKHAKENMEEYIKNNDKNIRKTYNLEADIDFKDKLFLPLGYKFSGVFNGNNHTLKNISSSTMVYETTKKGNSEFDDDSLYRYYFYGIFKKLLNGAWVKDLNLENVNLKNHDASNIKSYNEDRHYKNEGFGIICEKANEDSRISNITINNSNVDLIVKPGYNDLNKSFLAANFGLVAGSSNGSVSNIKILNSEITIYNKGASGMSCGIAFGRTLEKASVEFVSIKDSNLNVSNNINPNLILTDKSGDNSSTFVSEYYHNLGDSPKKNLSVYAGIMIGYEASGNVSSLYLLNNLIKSIDSKNDDKIATVRLNGKAMGFDYEESTSDKKANVGFSQINKKFYHIGEVARIYVRTDTNGPKQGGSLNNGLKRLYINNREISKSDLKEDPRIPFISYYEFVVYENVDALSITNQYEKREDALKENIYFENDKKAIFENITPGTFPGEAQSLFHNEQDVYYQIKKEKFDRTLHGYAVVTFKQLKEGQENNQKGGNSGSSDQFEKVYSWAKIDQNGKFRFIVRGKIERIEIMGQFISEFNIGHVYGFGKRVVATYLSNNQIEISNTGQNTISDINLTEIYKYTYNLGLFASSHKQLEVSNTVFENYTIKNTDGDTIFNINFDKTLLVNHYNNKNIFIGNKPKYFGSDVDVSIDTAFDKMSKEDIKKYLVLGYLVNENWFFKEFGLS